MTQYAAILFTIAAVAGATMAALHLKGRMPPWPLTILHGIFALSALVTLVMAAARWSQIGLIHVSLILFFLAAMGGLLVVSYHFRGRHPPRVLLLGHAAGAITAYVVLLVHLFGG